MKKFISMVMAAAMVVSLVPATAFAATGELEADKIQVVDAIDLVEDFAVDVNSTPANKADDVEGLLVGADVPEVTIRLDEVESANGKIKQEVKFKLDGAKFTDEKGNKVEDLKDTKGEAWVINNVFLKSGAELLTVEAGLPLNVSVDKFTNTSVTFVLTNTDANGDVESGKTVADLKQAIDLGNDTITMKLQSTLNKVNAGATAKVSVTSDIAGAEIAEKVYATVEGKGIDVELDDEVVEVAPEESVELEEIVVEPAVGSTFNDVMEVNDKVTLKVSKGFEFKENTAAVYSDGTRDYKVLSSQYVEDDEIEIEVNSTILGWSEFSFKNLKVEATDAKAGDECTLTVDFGDNDKVTLVVAKVIESGLSFSVDEEEDVPVMWSGVNSKNAFLTADEDEHVSLEMTIEEAFEESYSDKDEFEITIPDGVYVVGFEVTDYEGSTGKTQIEKAFADAYKEGDHKSFVFERDALVESKVESENAMEFSFEFTLVADPGFVGDVEVEMLVEGDSVGKAVIAKFETPMVVEAAQNDLKIDYRNTEVPTEIVIKEAEAGLWKEGLVVALALDHGIDFEDDATFTVNEESDMEISDDTDSYAIDKDGDGTTDAWTPEALYFEVDKESDDEAAVITISDISLYMDRNLAAGAYDLEMVYNQAIGAYKAETLFAPDCTKVDCNGVARTTTPKCDKNDDCIVDDVTDMSDVVKEAWVNIVTAGREQDDASFTTKVVVPVGEAYIVAGENTVALDVPAYVSAAGYTMLPVRAVAVALGINTNNVLWDQATKTVTILYGQRIITMTVGAKVINVNGSAIPASASVEVVNGRTFLPMRDLATALGVTDITWDAATKTATLNGNI